MSRVLILSLSLWLCLAMARGQNDTTLKGITVLRAPFVERGGPDEKLKGFFVDLLDELSQIGKFNYTLSDLNLPTTASSGLYENTPNGLINELYRHHADFAIADYLVRSLPRYVDFTEPYLVSGLSALVDKSRLAANSIHTIDDLLKENEKEEGEIALGTVRSSFTYRQLSLANDRIGRRVYERLYQHSTNNLVDTREEGITRALKEPYALIQETINNELAMDEHCELTELLLAQETPDGAKQGIQLEYTIAVQKVSKHLDTLNKAMRQLKTSGRLDELRRRYWNRKCNGSPSPQTRYLITSICTLFSLSISLFLLS